MNFGRPALLNAKHCRKEKRMVLYYSATGNTAFIARLISEKLGDELLDLSERVKTGDTSVISSERPFVICSPVYVCEMPFFLRDWLKKVSFSGSRDVYFIFTSGGYAGISGSLAKGIIRRKGMHYMGHAEFKMPRNYIASNTYPELEREEILRRISTSRDKTDEAAECIRKGERLRARYVFLFEKIITLPFTPIWIKLKQPSKDFHTTEKCVGCGKCAKVCPINNIRMENKRPVWIKSCAHCMACIGNCPTEAIEYGDITQKKVKYNIRKYLDN